MARLVLAVGGLDGHRREYINLFQDIARSSGIETSAEPLSISHIFSQAALFSPMLEEHTARFILVAILRGILGKRSSALLFRPAEAAHSGNFKHRLKKIMLRGAQLLPGVSVLTILPFSLDPSFASVAKGWIYDPQLWDWGDLDENGGNSDLLKIIAARANGRVIVTAIGAQNEGKGFDFLSAIAGSNADLSQNFLFVAGGKVSRSSREAAQVFQDAGGLLVDRFITDEELRDLYGISHIIWACYSPTYDQASGILGRAIQVGVPALVRSGSFVERLGRELGHQVVGLEWSDEEAAASAISTAPKSAARKDARRRVAQMRSESLTTLGRALGLKLEGKS